VAVLSQHMHATELTLLSTIMSHMACVNRVK
jgi:hypothetical protein